jgi:hypothetical protein
MILSWFAANFRRSNTAATTGQSDLPVLAAGSVVQEKDPAPEHAPKDVYNGTIPWLSRMVGPHVCASSQFNLSSRRFSESGRPDTFQLPEWLYAFYILDIPRSRILRRQRDEQAKLNMLSSGTIQCVNTSGRRQV